MLISRFQIFLIVSPVSWLMKSEDLLPCGEPKKYGRIVSQVSPLVANSQQGTSFRSIRGIAIDAGIIPLMEIGFSQSQRTSIGVALG